MDSKSLIATNFKMKLLILKNAPHEEVMGLFTTTISNLPSKTVEKKDLSWIMSMVHMVRYDFLQN